MRVQGMHGWRGGQQALTRDHGASVLVVWQQTEHEQASQMPPLGGAATTETGAEPETVLRASTRRAGKRSS
jgi:hypothetical protein